MKYPGILLLLLSGWQQAAACTTCNRPLQNSISESTHFPNLPVMLSAFFALALCVAVFVFLCLKKTGTMASVLPLTSAAIVAGIGLGGFADGIVLHQVLQWHEMLSNKIPTTDVVGKSVNMFWDGIFHLFCLLVVITGVVLLWKLLQRPEANRSGRLLAGGLLAGWAIFNIVEGVIDHQLLELHHVRQAASDPAPWNYGFLALSVLMLLAGLLLVNAERRSAKTHTPL